MTSMWASLLDGLKDGLNGFWSGMAEPERYRLFFRVAVLLKRTLYNGVAVFILATCTITISAAFLRIAFKEFAAYRQMTAQDLSPLWKEETPVIAASVDNEGVLLTLLSLVDDGTLPCATARGDCTFFSEVFNLMRTATTRIVDGAKPEEIKRRLASGINSSTSNPDWMTLLVADVTAWQQKSDVTGQVEALPTYPTLPSFDANFIRFGSETEVAKEHRISDVIFPWPSSSSTPSDVVSNSLRLTRVFDDVLQAATENQLRTGPKIGQGYQCVRVYFITPTGTVRVWNNQQLNPIYDSRFDGPWRVAHNNPKFSAFFTTFLAPDDRLVGTQIDMSGLGITKTLCRQIAERGVLYGSVCGDVTVPVDDALNAMRGNHLFRLEKIEVDPADPTDVKTGDVVVTDENDERIAGKQTTSRDVSPQRKQQLLDVLNRHKPLRLNRLMPLSADPDPSWLLPLGIRANRYVLLSVAPEPRRAPVSAYIDLTIATGMFILTFGIAVKGAEIARSSARRRDRIALLRGIQIGVVRLGGDDQVMEGNDRAEELFHKPLPKIGSDSTQLTRISDLINLDTVVLASSNSATLELMVHSYQEIRARGNRGEPYRFFARLAHGDTWVEFRGTPVVSRIERGGRPEIFCIVDIVRPAERTRLEVLAKERM